MERRLFDEGAQEAILLSDNETAGKMSKLQGLTMRGWVPTLSQGHV